MNNTIYALMIKYIEDNKINYNISYNDSIVYLKELIKSIEKEYEDIEII